MQSLHSDSGEIRAPRTEGELQDAVRVLGAVVNELAERIELLETRQAVADAGNR